MISLHINRQTRFLDVPPDMPLLWVLRDVLGLTGTKFGCGIALCGACTVHIDGQRVLACLLLAVAIAGRDITTVEGLAGPDDRLHPIQQAFIDRDAFQCGYCTPGQIMSAIACVKEGHARSRTEIQEFMSGNLCRCGAYPHIIAAIEQARDEMSADGA